MLLLTICCTVVKNASKLSAWSASLASSPANSGVNRCFKPLHKHNDTCNLFIKLRYNNLHVAQKVYNKSIHVHTIKQTTYLKYVSSLNWLHWVLVRKQCWDGQPYIWEIWSDRLSRQRSTYMYILINHWIATNITGVIASKIVKHVVRYIIFTLHARNVRLQRVPRSQMLTNWNDASRMCQQSESCCLLMCGWQHGVSIYVLKADILSIYEVTYYRFDDFWDNNCQSCL